jgi:outer membrane protein insertion porin family
MQTGTVDIEYQLVEKDRVKLNFKEVYGGGGFIGTLGLSFNNFSARNMFKKMHITLTDGRWSKVSLRLQAST